MNGSNSRFHSDRDLKERLSRRIQLRSGGRIRNIQITVNAGRATLAGHIDSYYLLSLAQAAARDVVDLENLEMKLVVSRQPPSRMNEEAATEGNSPAVTGNRLKEKGL